MTFRFRGSLDGFRGPSGRRRPTAETLPVKHSALRWSTGPSLPRRSTEPTQRIDFQQDWRLHSLQFLCHPTR